MNHMSADSSPRLFTPRTAVLLAMIALTIGYRLVVHFVPGVLPYNATPVEAMALFGGAYFANRWLAVAIPLMAMAAADVVIAASLPAGQLALWLQAAPVIYACIALTAVAGFSLRHRVKVVNVALAAVGSATGFFLITNFAAWLVSSTYAASASGLAACYIAGLPFYQYGSLPGTLFWSTALFGGFALLSRRFTVLSAAPVQA